MTDHLADVRRYDATANAEIVNRIVKHLGIALRSPVTSVVAGVDPDELERVRAKWCEKKFGFTDRRKANMMINLVCETMAADETKSRVTFYYLVAKHMGVLDRLAK